MDYQPKHRARTAQDELHDMWAALSERNKVRYAAYEKPYCQGFEDGLDGFVIHAPACPDYQDTAISGSSCIDYRGNCRWPYGLSEVR